MHYIFALPTGRPVRSPDPAIIRATNDIVVTWMAPGGTTNVVQATNGSSGSYTTNGFANISSSFVNPGGRPRVVTNMYTDSFGATNKPSRYYRIRQTP